MDTHNQVTLKKVIFESNKLILTVIDSASDAAESAVEVPVLENGSLQIGEKKDQASLAHEWGFYLTLHNF